MVRTFSEVIGNVAVQQSYPVDYAYYMLLTMACFSNQQLTISLSFPRSCRLPFLRPSV